MERNVSQGRLSESERNNLMYLNLRVLLLRFPQPIPPKNFIVNRKMSVFTLYGSFHKMVVKY